jgi:flagellar hook-basal body complex protein FliE
MAGGAANINSALQSIAQQQSNGAVKAANQQQITIPFKAIFNEAVMGQQQAVQVSQGAQVFTTRQQVGAPPRVMDDPNLMAQAIPEEFQRIEDIIREQEQQDSLQAAQFEEGNYRSHKLDITPFQLFMDKSIASLENLSKMEMQVNDLMEQYIQGRASIDEVSMETAKLNLSLQFVTSVLTSAVQTFKEVLQMAI